MKLSVSGESIEGLLYLEQKPILEIRICFPQIGGALGKRAEYAFNDRYRSRAVATNRIVRTRMFKDAEEQARLALGQDVPFTMHSFLSSFYVPRARTDYTSVVFDRFRYSGGAHGTVRRVAETWDVRYGRRVPLSFFFTPQSNWRARLFRHVERQAMQQSKKEETFYFEGLPHRIRASFRDSNYYLTHDAIRVFYPLYSLAPYYVGIPEYEIPFETFSGCWRRGAEPKTVRREEGRFSEPATKPSLRDQ